MNSSSYYVPQLQASGAPAMPMGGGGPDELRMRWGRVGVVLAAVVVLMFAGYQLLGASVDPERSVTGGGGAPAVDDTAPAINSFATSPGTGSPSGPASGDGAGAGIDPAPQGSNTQTLGLEAERRERQAERREAQRREQRQQRAEQRRAERERAAAGGGGAGTAHAAEATHADGAYDADGLPMTGAPTWLAAVIGFLLLAGGTMLQLRAERVATTASGYRRGPLLRPADTVGRLYDRWYHWRLGTVLRS